MNLSFNITEIDSQFFDAFIGRFIIPRENNFDL